MAEDGGGVYKRLLLPHMRILNNPPTAHTPQQKRDARSKAAPNPPPARPRRASERSRCSGAETSARLRRGPTPRRRRRETGSAGAVGGHGRGAAARTVCGTCGANVGGERERPARGKVPVPSGGGWWELCAAQLMNLKLFL